MRSFAIGMMTAVALLTLSTRPARAQGYFSPNIGVDFGGDAGNCPSLLNDCSQKRTSFGLTTGFLAAGIFGFEEDFAYAPDFFGQSSTFGSNSVLTLMSNLVIGIPAGPVRPYVSGGFGLMRTNVELNLASLANVNFNNNAFGYDFGGGVMLFLPYHLGVRGDFRYLRSAKSMTIGGISFNNRQLNFSRASIGLVLH